MPSFDIIKKSSPAKSFRVASVIGKFDLQSNEIIEQFKGGIDIEDAKWNIGLIVGRSGTGKSSIAKEIFGEKVISGYSYIHESIVDDMPQNKSIDEIVSAFNSVGFSSPHSWIKQYSVLSNGEKMRVDLARAMLENHDVFVFDEFTSVVDRKIAQIGSFAIQKAIRSKDNKFIAVSCHYDIIDWLLPDWIFSTDEMKFAWCDKKKDQKSNLRFSEQSIRECGRFLVSITI